MLVKDNVVIKVGINRYGMMNLHTFKRKIINTHERELIRAMSEDTEALNDEVDQFEKKLFAEKQFLTKEEKHLLAEMAIEFNSNNDLKIDTQNIGIFLTSNCNCNCSYCYQNESNNLRKLNNLTMTKEQLDNIRLVYKQFEDEGKCHNNYTVHISGGEIFYSEKEYQLIEYAMEIFENATFVLTTNAVNVENYIDKLNLDRIQSFRCSLDGIAGIHNERRPLKDGRGSFDYVISGIEEIIKRQKDIELLITIDKETLKYLPDLFNILESKGWIDNELVKYIINPVFDLDRGFVSKGDFNSEMTLINEFRALKEKDIRIRNKLKGGVGRSFGGLMQYFRRPIGEKMMPSIYRCKCLNTPQYTFDPSGSITLCNSFVGKKGGEIGTFYPSINLDKTKVNALKNRAAIYFDKCKSCDFIYVCKGGCPYEAFAESGTMNQPFCGIFKDQMALEKMDEFLML